MLEHYKWVQIKKTHLPNNHIIFETNSSYTNNTAVENERIKISLPQTILQEETQPVKMTRASLIPNVCEKLHVKMCLLP